jgi:hypothetical protein
MAPAGVRFTSANLAGGFVSITDVSGAAHAWKWTGSGYAPPPGEDGILAADAQGLLTLHADDGLTYAFDATGRLVSASAATDDASASSLRYEWETPQGKPPRLVGIHDPVGDRRITIHYRNFNSSTACTAATPDLKPCQIDYWDGTRTMLGYSNGQLARFEDPGGAVTDLAFDQFGAAHQGPRPPRGRRSGGQDGPGRQGRRRQ